MSDKPNTVPPHFIVFVPGYMGSRLRDRKTGEIIWLDIPHLLSDPFDIPKKLDRFFKRMRYPNDDLEPAGIIDQIIFAPPLFKQEHYGRFLEALLRMGYDIPGSVDIHDQPNVYTFDYDWRQDNRISARQLGQAIQVWESKNPGAKAWLIGHSNGGIVSRWYIEKEGGANHVQRLFLMCSPWDGAPKAMKVILDGLDVFFLRLFNPFDISRRTRELVLSFPSYYQLIPHHFPFLRDAVGDQLNPFSDMSWLENDRQRQMMLDAKRFNQELGTGLSVETLCFFGVKKPTTIGGLVRFDSGGRWADIDWDQTEDGDGTVPQRSAVHPQAHEKLPYMVGHGDIYVSPPVLEKLQWELITKYRTGLLAVKETDSLKIQFEPQRDVFNPGELIQIWATVVERQKGTPVSGAQISVSLEWSQELPGFSYQPPVDLPSVRLAESRMLIGRYEGGLTAPVIPGYYRLLAKVESTIESAVILEELILIEGDLDLARLSGRSGSQSHYPQNGSTASGDD